MEHQQRSELICQWVSSGESRPTTVAKTAKHFGVSYQQAQAMVTDAMAGTIAVYGSIERQEFLAQQMSRLEVLATRAQEEGNLSVALAAYRELNSLAKLHG